MDLGLPKIVTKEFAFLEYEYDFECVEAGSWLVRYENDTVFINIHFDGNRSYEFGCELGRKDDLRGSLKVPFDIGEIIRSKERSKKNIRSSFQVTNSGSLKKFTKELSYIVKHYAQEFLTGSNTAFHQAADFRDKECVEYALETDLKLMRSELASAWQNRDFKKVVELLVPLEGNLKQSEIKKLKYALKMEGGSVNS